MTDNTVNEVTEMSIRIDVDTHKRLARWCDEQGYVVKRAAALAINAFLDQRVRQPQDGSVMPPPQKERANGKKTKRSKR